MHFELHICRPLQSPDAAPTPDDRELAARAAACIALLDHDLARMAACYSGYHIEHIEYRGTRPATASRDSQSYPDEPERSHVETVTFPSARVVSVR